MSNRTIIGRHQDGRTPRRGASTALSTLAATTFIGAALAGCGGVSNSSAPGPSGNSSSAVLVVAPNPSGPFVSTFNPFLPTAGGASGSVDNVIYEPLYMPDPVTAKYSPWLATGYTWSDGGKTLTLTIRNGVKWSDGKPLSASDVAYTFNLMKSQPALNTGGLPLAGAKALNATTAVIDYTIPGYPYFDATVATKPVPEHIWSQQADPATYPDRQPVGSGPYLLKSFTPQAITLTKNPSYWQAADVHVQTMRYLAFDSASSVEAALESGQIDLEDHVFTDFNSLIKRPGLAGLLINVGTVQLLPNVTKYPLNLLAVRKALNVALDRKAIAQQGLGGLQAPATSPTGLPEALADQIAPAYKNQTYGAADPAQAKQLLEAAGFKLGGDGIFVTPKGTPLSLTLLLGTGQGNLLSAAQVMKAQLKNAGIGLSVQTEDFPAVHSAVLQGKFELNIYSDAPYTPFSLYRPMLDTRYYVPVGQRAAYDLNRFQDPTAESAYATWAASSPGSAAADAARNEIEKIMVEQVPSIPLFSTAPQGAYNTRKFTGWPTAKDPYTLPSVIGDEAEVLMLHVRPR